MAKWFWKSIAGTMFFSTLISFAKGIPTINVRKIGSVSCQCTCHDANDPLIAYDGAGKLELNTHEQPAETRSTQEVKYRPIVHGHTVSPKTVKVVVPKLSESYDSRVSVQSIEKIHSEHANDGAFKSSSGRDEKMNAMVIPMFAVKSSQLLKTLKPPKRTTDKKPSSPTFPPPPPPPPSSSDIGSDQYTKRISPFSSKDNGTQMTTLTSPEPNTKTDITTIPTTTTTPTTSTITTTTTTTPPTTSELTTTTKKPTTKKATTKKPPSVSKTTTMKPTVTTKELKQNRVTIVRHRPSSQRHFQSDSNNSRQKSTSWASSSMSSAQQSSSLPQTWNSRFNGNTWNTVRKSPSSGFNSGKWNNLPQSGFFQSSRNSQSRPTAHKTHSPTQHFSSTSRNQNRQFSATSRSSRQPAQSSVSKLNSHQPHSNFGKSWSKTLSNQNRMKSSKFSTNSKSTSQNWSLPNPKFSYKQNTFQDRNHNSKTKFSIPFQDYKPSTTIKPKTPAVPNNAAYWGMTNFHDRKLNSQHQVSTEIPSLQLFVTVPKLEVSESVTKSSEKTSDPPAVEFKMPAHTNSTKLNSTSKSTSTGSIEMLTGLIQTLKTNTGGTGVAHLLKDLMSAKNQNQMDSMISQLHKQVGPPVTSSVKTKNVTENQIKASGLLNVNRMPDPSNSMALLDRDMWHPEPTHPSERNFGTTEHMPAWDFSTPSPNNWNTNGWNKHTTGLPQSITPITNINNPTNLGPVGQTGNIHQQMFNFDSWMPSNTPWNSNNRQSVLFAKTPTGSPIVKDAKSSQAVTKDKSSSLSLETVQNTKTGVANAALPSSSTTSKTASLTSLLKQLTAAGQTNSGIDSASSTPVRNDNTNNAVLIDLLKQLTASSSKQLGSSPSSSNLLKGSSKNNHNIPSSHQIPSTLLNIPNIADFMGLQNQAMTPNINAQGFPNIQNFGVPGMEFPAHMAGMGTMGGWENPFK